MLAQRLKQNLEALGVAGAEALNSPFAAVAWSGGADSTALLLAYLELLNKESTPVMAIHIDHQIRPGSHLDAAWCEEKAASIGPDRLKLVSLEMGGLNQGASEGSARQRRYELLSEAAAAAGRGVVLTAHHADDNVESLLLALVRGSGLTGIGGARRRLPMNLVTGHLKDSGVTLIRPLLDVSRQELVGWLSDRGETFCEDPTNALMDRKRNVLRHKVVPVLKSLAGTPSPLWRSLRVLSTDRDLLERLSLEAFKKARRTTPYHYVSGCALSTSTLRSMDIGLARHVLRAAVRQTAQRPYPPDEASVNRALKLGLDCGAGTQSIQIAGLDIIAEGDLLIVGAVTRTLPHPQLLQPGGEVSWGRRTVRARLQESTSDTLELRTDVEKFDLDGLNLPLRVRSIKNAERLEKWGGGHRRLSRILIDHKVPHKARPWIPIVEDAEGEVIWVADLARSAAAPVTITTKTCLILEVNENQLAQDAKDD